MNQPAVLGLDLGTSAVKAMAVDSHGTVVATGSAPLELSAPEPGWTEQDPEAWWVAAQEAIRQIVQAYRGSIVAIGISGQMHSSVFLDRSGRVIRPALLWSDGRTTAECAEILRASGGEATLARWVRNPALEGFTLPKVLWLRNQEPGAFARLATILLPKDWIRYRLTDQLATEPSDASGTLMFDPAGRRWSTELLKAVELSATLLPVVGGSAEVLGQVSAAAARATGLTEGIPVVGGGADNACGALGVGAIEPGEMVVSWGTSGTVLAPTATPAVDPGLRVHTFCHLIPDRWYLMGVVLSAGGAWDWYRDRFAPELRGRPDRDDRLTTEASEAPIGSGGVTFLPYLQGERTPHRDATLRGGFLGLSLAHDRRHLTRAVLEGICFALRDSVEILGNLGVAPEEILVTGGGARSPFIRALEAEIFGLPVRTVNRDEGPAFGAALLAAVGVGIFPDLGAAIRATIERNPPTVPAIERCQAYQHHYRRFSSWAQSLATRGIG